MDARQDKVTGWRIGVAVATAATAMIGIAQLSFHAPGRAATSRHLAASDWPTLGAPPVFVAATAPVATPPRATPAPGPALVEATLEDLLNLIEPIEPPAEVLSFPLAGQRGFGGYDPVANLPPLDLLKPIRTELQLDWDENGDDQPIDLAELVIAPLAQDTSDLVVLTPAPARWRAGSHDARWTLFGVRSAAAAEQAGRLAATGLNLGRDRTVSVLDASRRFAAGLLAEWGAASATPRVAGVIHSPPALARPMIDRPLVDGPADRLAMAVSPGVKPKTSPNNRLVDDNTTPPAGGNSAPIDRVPLGAVPLGAAPLGAATLNAATPDEAGLATPTTLLEQVRLLMVEPATSTWAMRVEFALDAALAVRPGDVEGFARVSRELRGLALEGSDLAELVDSQRAAVLLRRACYGIFRRLAAWDLAMNIESQRVSPAALRPPPTTATPIVASAHERWERIAHHLAGRPGAVPACAVLNGKRPERLRVIRLTGFHPSVWRSAGPSPRARPGTDYDAMRFLSQLEAYERERDPRLGQVIASDLRGLRASERPAARRLAERVDRQYRNANVRLAIAGELIERLLPREPRRSTRLNDRVLGATVRGVASTDSTLSLRLTPDPMRWLVGLRASGRVTTRAQSTTGPVVLHSRGVTEFTAHKRLEVDHSGVRFGAAQCRATNQSRLTGVNTNLDGVPVVRRVVRSRAEQEYAASRGAIRQAAERQVEQRVSRELDTQAATAISGLQDRYNQAVAARAQRLGVAVTPVEMRTTDRRLITRLRVAAAGQLGSHTPRTRAPSDSLASLQLHESAINNAAAGLGLAGERFTPESLRRRLAERLAAPSIAEKELDTPAIELVFAEEQPVSVSIGDGAVRVALAIAEMRVGGSRYRDFRVHATYKPEPLGNAAVVRRTGAIEIEGRLKTTSRLKLHGVFGKVLSDGRTITLIAPPAGDDRFDGLMITQMVMADGWLGLAIGPAESPAIRGKRVAVAGRYFR